MAVSIKLNHLRSEDKEFLQSTLMVENEELFEVVDDDYVLLPFAFARKTFELDDDISNQHDQDEPTTTTTTTDELHKLQPTTSTTPTFVGELREEQIVVKNGCLENLKETGSFIISSCPGFGKTITAINIACELNVKTLIITNKLVLINQWMESVKKFTNSTTTVQYVKPGTTSLNPSATFYVVNAINVAKKPLEFWSSVKFLVIDELHQIITKVLSKSLFRIVPDYILGLSATPYRFDDYHNAIEWFFGSSGMGKKLYCKHSVCKLRTGFKPQAIKYTSKGIDWNSVLEEQADNEERNDMIVKGVKKISDRDKGKRVWMILVKRVVHAETLVEKFEREGMKCTTLLGSAVEFDKSCKILIGTTSKIGVGFDHADIDALCIAADVKNYFVQFLGRCMRRPNSNPVVLDLEDDFYPLTRHFNERVTEYKRCGGKMFRLEL